MRSIAALMARIDTDYSNGWSAVDEDDSKTQMRSSNKPSRNRTAVRAPIRDDSTDGDGEDDFKANLSSGDVTELDESEPIISVRRLSMKRGRISERADRTE